jgi:hypothetical protein
VAGYRWFHARQRAMPVESARVQVLNNLNNMTEGQEKSAYKRRAHDEAVVNTAKGRKEKELERQRKKNPPTLQAAPNPPQQGAQGQNSGYGGPASIYDLGKRESA